MSAIPQHLADEAGALVAAENGTTLVLSLLGSRAYGFETPVSDWDLKGVWIADLKVLLGIDRHPGHLRPEAPDDEKPQDTMLYELSSFFALAAKGSASGLETLWAATSLRSELGERLFERREIFLSALVGNEYLGYAREQINRACGRADEGYDLARKPARHGLRLLEAGRHFCAHGEIMLRPSDPAAIALAAETLTRDELRERFETERYELERLLAQTDLPAEPDRAAINALAVELRLAAADLGA
jgi:uncharacterized protein